MPIKAIIPSSPKKISFIAKAIKHETERVAREIKQELESVVQPLHSDIHILMDSERDSQDWVIDIYGNPNDTASINAAGDGVSSHDLLMWIDGGTSERWVAMPDDFDNETFPNSLSTRDVDYDREGIRFLDSPRPGIEARNWLKLLNEKHSPDIKRNISNVVRRYLG